MKRWVNKGARGIALISIENGRNVLKYVFDVTDTHSGINKELNLWEVKASYANGLIETLENSFGKLEIKDNLAQAIKGIVAAIVAGGWVAVIIIIVIVLISGLIAAIFYGTGDDEYEFSQIPSSQILLVAKAQLGNEGGDKFWKWYGSEEHVHWCACYVSYCANECGYTERGIMPKFALCTDGIKWFKEIEQWHDRSDGYYPMIADIIFFDWKDENGNQDGNCDHVGIVTRTDMANRTIYTIEGNTSNKCAERMYSFDDVQVIGYGSPKYE